MAGVIAEIATECGVSEQAVRAWCRRNYVAKDAKGSFAISESQKNAIYRHYLGYGRNQVSQPTKASCETCETSKEVLISMLQKELDRKNEQLEVKDKQIEELNERLSEVSSALVVAQQTAQAAQALHAGTLQQGLTSGGEMHESVEVKPQKKDGLVGCFLAKTVRRYKDGESGCIMKKIDSMNYLVFDRNLFNSLKAGEIQRVYYCSKDFSIFDVTDGDMLQYINWADFNDVLLAKNSLVEHPLTILYSFCPAEICGLFAAITFFREKEILICVSRPHLQSIISYSDFSSGEIIDSLKKDCVMLSAAQIEAISDEWSLIIQNQSNLRIFYKNKVVNVQDDYFDTDISCVLQKKGNIALADILPDIQLSLRRKYGFGLNPRYIEWRVSNVLGLL